ncbi:hypothetical protein [Opacimonas viscosa]|uniref:Uncharacterized protein n=1 Tax=Opacimonas viscosa TaxID=2961944 RepID=A0AA41X4E5_9ALTE|nr:hypothetical protein [Opacimonas viscosa]MCP3428414.1 hypothetical protein [Opacimonas viscosa]
MDLQYRYIYISLAVTLGAISSIFVFNQQPAILVVAIFSIAAAFYLVSEQRRYMNMYKRRLQERKDEQANLSSLLASEINNMILECEKSLLNINSTQQDAIDLIGNSFVEIQSLMLKQSTLVQRNVDADSLEYAQVTRLAGDIRNFMNESIRGMQFGDINTQNLQFCLDTLRFIREHIETIGQDDLDVVIADIREYLETLQKRRDVNNNPVSSKSMQAGEIEFF